MQDILNATDVRRHWSQFNDDIVRDGPRFVKRNRDVWAALSSQHLQAAFSDFKFEAEFLQEEDESYTVILKGFDLVENAEDKDEALDLIAEELIDYAHDYLDNFNNYFNSPNRKSHFPFIINVLAQEDSEGVKRLIKCPAGERQRAFAAETDGRKPKRKAIISFFKKMDDGTVKRTKVSSGTGEVKGHLWQQILKTQLQVTLEEFNKKK